MYSHCFIGRQTKTLMTHPSPHIFVQSNALQNDKVPPTNTIWHRQIDRFCPSVLFEQKIHWHRNQTCSCQVISMQILYCSITRMYRIYQSIKTDHKVILVMLISTNQWHAKRKLILWSWCLLRPAVIHSETMLQGTTLSASHNTA